MVLLAVIVRALMEDNVFPTLENLFVLVNQGSGESIANREIMDNLETQDVSEILAPLILSNTKHLLIWNTASTNVTTITAQSNIATDIVNDRASLLAKTLNL